MTEKTTKYKHLICLLGLFILGESVIATPYSGADSLNVLALFCACAIAAVSVFLITPLLPPIFSDENEKKNPILRAAVTFCYCIAIIISLFSAAKAFVSLNDFVCEVMLIKTPRFITAFILAILAVVATAGDRNNIFKFSLISTVVCALIIVALFVFSIPNFELGNIIPYTYLPSHNILGQIAEYSLKVFAPCAVAVVYICATHEAPRGTILCDGVLLGGIMLLLCVANSILIFGAPTAAKMQFPYSDAVSLVSIGELYTRMDGLSYLLIFISTATKITVCLKTARIFIKRLGFKYERSFVAACGALMVVLAVI